MNSSLKISFYLHGPAVGCIIGENPIEGVAGFGDSVSEALSRLAENVKRVEDGYFTEPEIDFAVQIHELNRIARKAPFDDNSSREFKGYSSDDE